MHMTNDEPERDISIVLPVYNEAGNLEIFIPELSRVLQAMGRTYEIIAVDDGFGLLEFLLTVT